jgi:hypothetical protein
MKLTSQLLKLFTGVFLCLIPINSNAEKSMFRITLGSGNPNEEKAKQLIGNFEKKFDLSPYIFTKEIIIKSKVIPHSHPILTLNTRQIDEPDRYLSLLLHEQIHWFFSGTREAKTKKFIEKIKLKYPKVPNRENGGANDDESTYLHFAVCYYELEALTRYLGKQKAEEIFKTADVYSWINKEVLANRAAIKAILEDVGLQWEDANKSMFETANQLVQLWQAELIYYQPKNKDEPIFWNGIVYDYESKKCFEVKQDDSSEKIKSSETKCEASFLKQAVDPYLKISNFKEYRNKFISCIKADDKTCLRQLISKTITLSFGVDGNQDRRNIIFSSWKREDYNRLVKLIAKGAAGDEYSKTFPPEPDNDGVGYRGEFKKIDGGWLLVSYLAGD